MLVKLIATGIAALLFFVVLIAAAAASILTAFTNAGNSGSHQPSPHALADIPADYLALYQQAAPTCPGLDWSILAAIGKVETDHGRSTLPGVAEGTVNHAQAGGPMQFLQPTFDAYDDTIPPGGATPPSRYNPHDAIHAAAAYLCDSGAPEDLYTAIYAYNHADWYVRKVLAQAEQYRTAATVPPQAGGWGVPAQGTCTSGFGPRNGERHNGLDIAAPTGTPIVAATDGTVIDSGPATGYGLWIRIQHPGGVITTYGHNHTNHVQSGQAVRAGQPIGEIGNRGESTGPHLHFQIDAGGQPVDPVTYYQQQGAPSLCG
ncbi:peptidoglycan DD-metalloendopeptidase family protein [Saccharopolyspora cebuensis]|uniref:Peptidoglycan DD-metalloendopeptidase family protein n=1 Tax=Saccharopolyspora cebuensis TaxID=418759 RepID=A0ABV4CPQ6_9PSEU